MCELFPINIHGRRRKCKKSSLCTWGIHREDREFGLPLLLGIAKAPGVGTSATVGDSESQALVNASISLGLLWMPLNALTTCPSLYRNMRGMLTTSNLAASSLLSSTLTLPITTPSGASLATWSRMVPSILHGLHHGAQKSTSTTPDFVTSSKFVELSSLISAMIVSPHLSLRYYSR